VPLDVVARRQEPASRLRGAVTGHRWEPTLGRLIVDFDGIVIGGGHNALTCAAYLAKASARILVLERNDEVGGGTTTWEVT
jgi:ribulose 1,5-bisphosphate synthetase/thiazole synthase